MYKLFCGWKMMKHPRASLLLTTSWNLLLKSPNSQPSGFMIYWEIHGFLRPFTQLCEEVRDYRELHKQVSQGSHLDLTLSWWWHFPDIYGNSSWEMLIYRHRVEFPEAGISSAMCIVVNISIQTSLSWTFETWRNGNILCRSKRRGAETCSLSPSTLHPQPPLIHATHIRWASKMLQLLGRIFPTSPYQEAEGFLASKGWAMTP